MSARRASGTRSLAANDSTYGMLLARVVSISASRAPFRGRAAGQLGKHLAVAGDEDDVVIDGVLGDVLGEAALDRVPCHLQGAFGALSFFAAGVDHCAEAGASLQYLQMASSAARKPTSAVRSNKLRTRMSIAT